MACVGDEDALFVSWMGVVEFFAVPRGDEGVVFSVDDEEAFGDVGDFFKIVEFVKREEGDASHDAEGGGEGAFKDEGVAVVLEGEFGGGAATDGASPEDDVFFGVAALEGILVEEGACLVATFFGGSTLGESVAGVVEGEDGEVMRLKAGDDGVEMAKVFGVAVEEEDEVLFVRSFPEAGGEAFAVVFFKEGEVWGGFRVAGLRVGEEEIVGGSAADEEKNSVDEEEGAAESFPRQFPDEELSPGNVHLGAGV